MIQEVVNLPNVAQTIDIVPIYASLFGQHPRDLLKGMVCLRVKSDASCEDYTEIWSHETILCHGPKYFKSSNSSSATRIIFSVEIWI